MGAGTERSVNAKEGENREMRVGGVEKEEEKEEEKLQEEEMEEIRRQIAD